MRVQLKDQRILDIEAPMSVKDLAEHISGGLGRAAVGAVVNGVTVDLRTVIEEACDISILTFDDEEGKKVFWHSASHLLAQAVKRLYPDAKLAIGPAISNGFYYDVDTEETIDLEALEQEMMNLVKEDLAISRFELPRNEAIALMKERRESYKVELINELPEDEVISFYQQGDFIDLCAGPHIQSTKSIKAIKLLSLAGAYWKGSEENKMLTRIYGTAFPKQKLLKEHLVRLEEARKRDHRKIGKELGLFTMYEEGPGFPVFLNKGIVLKDVLLDYWKQVHHRHDYQEVSTPLILNRQLWETSGHWDYYRDNMYTTVIDDEDYAIKPMNCPGGMLAYKTARHSYRDLPLRMAELGMVHRHELSGTLHGLMRVRSFTQDDAHIFMTKDQVKDEIKGVMALIDEVYTRFGFSYHVELSTRPEKSIGSTEDWDMATEALRMALEEKEMPYVVNEGDGAFYGPKIDYHLVDCIGRTWQCGTIQLDFQLPARFELTYTSHEDKQEQPIMLHRVVYGSIERFIGILIEHFAGAFPYWMAPVQVSVLSVSTEYNDYAESVAKTLSASGIRVEKDTRNERIGFKIREASKQKIPYLLIVGEKEMADGTVSVRARGEKENKTMSIQEFAALEVTL